MLVNLVVIVVVISMILIRCFSLCSYVVREWLISLNIILISSNKLFKLIDFGIESFRVVLLMMVRLLFIVMFIIVLIDIVWVNNFRVECEEVSVFEGIVWVIN